MSTISTLNSMKKNDLITLVFDLQNTKLVLIEERDGARAELEKVYNVNASLLREIEELKNQTVVMGCEKRIDIVEAKSFGNLLKYHGLMVELKYFGGLFVSKKIQVVNDHEKYFIIKGSKRYEQDFNLLKKALEAKGEKVYLQSDLNGIRLNIVK